MNLRPANLCRRSHRSVTRITDFRLPVGLQRRCRRTQAVNGNELLRLPGKRTAGPAVPPQGREGQKEWGSTLGEPGVLQPEAAAERKVKVERLRFRRPGFLGRKDFSAGRCL
jgi:hypothetical protein